MYLTTLKFHRALEWFKQSSYDYMLLYASGSSKIDYDMVGDFLRYKDLIDRQTGKLVCFLHFIERTESNDSTQGTILQAEHKDSVESFMLYHIMTEEAKQITRRELYNGVGLEATYQTTDEICDFFGIARYKLPAFILIHKLSPNDSILSFKKQYSIISIKEKKDFESLLNPIKIANDCINDLDLINKELSSVESEPTYNAVLEDIEAIKRGIENLKSEKKTDLIEKLNGILSEINSLLCDYHINNYAFVMVRPYIIKKYLTHTGVIKEFMRDHNDLYYRYKSLFYKIEKWDHREMNFIKIMQSDLINKEKLLVRSQTRESRIKTLIDESRYVKELYKKSFEEKLMMEDASPLITAIISRSSTLPMIFESAIKTYLCKDILVRSIINDVREKVNKMQFNVFISCKSEDYENGEELYAFLKSKGYMPFIASKSLREIGGDKYSSVISDVIDICSHMIVYATNILYVETPYVKSEWDMFCNEIKAGRKKGKLLTILRDPKQGVNLPIDLRSREVLSIDSYKNSICNYLY